jgi:glycosyltransferase involved in cell wall biosynthesis
MKILLISHFFPPIHNTGTEKRTLGYAQNLLERGHQVHVLCAGNYEEGARQYWNGHTDEIYHGIPVRRINLFWQKSPNPNGYLYKNPRTAKFLKRCLMEWQPDLLHITSCLTLSASIIKAAKESGLPVVLTLTDYWFICHKLSLLKFDASLCDGITTSRECIQCLSWDSGIYRNLRRAFSDRMTTRILDLLSRIPAAGRLRALRGMAPNISERKEYLVQMLNLPDVVIAPSQQLRETLRQSGIRRGIRVIQSGHDLSWLKKEMQKTPNERVRFGYIGQFIFPKGVHVLLEAFSKCNWDGRAELHLFGGTTETLPAYWQELQRKEYLKSKLVKVHGPFEHERLGEILEGIDVLVVPSMWYENNPRVIQEAFASKTPVIASNVGGISEYVQDGINGYLFRRGDSADLAARMQSMMEDPAQIQRLASKAPTIRTIREEMDEIVSIYESLCAGFLNSNPVKQVVARGPLN